MTRSLTLAALILLIASPAGAQTAPRKFGRGLAGMTTSVLEVPGNIVAESRERGYGEGIPLGLVGVWEFLSAPFPVPAGYEPILRPEFPWGYFQGGREEAPKHGKHHR